MLDRLDSSGCVLTTVHEGRRAACFATYVIAAGLANQRLLVLTSHENLTHELPEQSSVLAVHLCRAGARTGWSSFGHRSSRDVDKLEGLAWREGETGAPILADALGYLEGSVIGTLDCGDHTARLVEPVAGELLQPDAEPLTMFEILRLGLDEPRVEAPPG